MRITPAILASPSIRNSPNSILFKGASAYQKNFDVEVIKLPKIAQEAENWEAFKNQSYATLKIDSESLKQLTANQSKVPLSPEQLSQIDDLKLRKTYLSSADWDLVKKADPKLAELKQRMLVHPNLFTEDEMNVIQGRVNSTKNVASLDVKQKIQGDHPVINFAKGLAFVGVTMVADHYLDKVFTGHDHKEGLTNNNTSGGIPFMSWNTNALFVPMAFATGGWDWKGLGVKAAYTGGALVLGKVLDQVLPASDHRQFSQWLRPNGVDGFLLGAAYVMPVGDMKTRLAMIAGAWSLSRVANMFQSHTSTGDVKNEAFDKMKVDMVHRSANSMNDAIDTFRNLGANDNYALRLYTSDWLRPGRQYDGALSPYRGAVILCDAFGESRLDKGTLLPNSNNDFVLQGKQLDLGGQALRSLLIAQVNVDRAKQQTQNEVGKDEKGSKVSANEITDLDEVGKRVNNTIQNRIYGAHDIPACINELADLYKGNAGSLLKMKLDLDNSVALNRNTTNKQFVAKLFRDMACIQLSIAQLKFNGPDGEGASIVLYGSESGRKTPFNDGQPRGYDGALDAIALAKQLDPTNPDIPQLESIAQQLKQKAPAAVQNQANLNIFQKI